VRDLERVTERQRSREGELERESELERHIELHSGFCFGLPIETAPSFPYDEWSGK